METRDVGISFRLAANQCRLKEALKLRDFCYHHRLAMAEGFELRAADSTEPIDEVPELGGLT